MKSSITKTPPVHPSHIKFIEKARLFAKKHNLILRFYPCKNFTNTISQTASGTFFVPKGKKRGMIRVACGNGWDKAMKTLAHELCHAKEHYYRPKAVFETPEEELAAVFKEEIRVDKAAMRMLVREKVKINWGKAMREHKKYIADYTELFIMAEESDKIMREMRNMLKTLTERPQELNR